MRAITYGRVFAAAWLASAALLAAHGPLETSVEGARKMLIREKLADDVWVFRSLWTSTSGRRPTRSS